MRSCRYCTCTTGCLGKNVYTVELSRKICDAILYVMYVVIIHDCYIIGIYIIIVESVFSSLALVYPSKRLFGDDRVRSPANIL